MFEVDIKVGEEAAGQRVDRFLSDYLPEVSRGKIQAALKAGKIKLNGAKTKANVKLRGGDQLVGVVQDGKSFELVAEPLALEVLYEDDAVMVVDKPAGVVVHPSDDGMHATGSVANMVKDLVAPGEYSSDLRPGIVHRLDKETSGLLIVAKTQGAYAEMVEVFKERRIRKFYTALVDGEFERPKGRIEAAIARSERDRKKMSVAHGSGKEAVTLFEVKEKSELRAKQFVSLLDVEILTGRTHQIRVHMSSIGHPVVGDQLYGKKSINQVFGADYGLERQFLHASRLEFVSPDTKEAVTVESPLPKDLSTVLKQL